MKKKVFKLVSIFLFCITILLVNIKYSLAEDNSNSVLKIISKNITSNTNISSTYYNIIDPTTGIVLSFDKTSNNYYYNLNGKYKDISSTDGTTYVKGLNGSFIIKAINNDKNLYSSQTSQNVTIYDFQSKTQTITFLYEQSNGNAIVRLKSENGEAIKNSKFVIKDYNNKDINFLFKNGEYYYTSAEGQKEIITNSIGEIVINNLPIGDYQIIQTSTPEEYNGLLCYSTFTIDNQLITNIDFINTKEYGNLNISIFDLENSNTYLNGTVIQIKDSSNNIVYFEQINDTYHYTKNEEISEITIQNGVLSLLNLPTGKYTIEEISPPKNYKPSGSQNFEIRKNTITEIVFNNENSKGNVHFFLHSEEGLEPISDVVYNLISKETEKPLYFKYQNGYYICDINGSAELKTNNKGIFVVDSLPIGEYYLKQIKVTSGYLNNNENLNVVVETDNETKITSSLRKSSNFIYFKNENLENVKDVSFEIINDDNECVVSYNSDETGMYLLPNLNKGTYFLRITAVPDTYEALNYDFEFTIDDNGEMDKCLEITLCFNKLTINALKENVKIIVIDRLTGKEYYATTDYTYNAVFRKMPIGDYKVLVDDKLATFDGLSFEIRPNSENKTITLDVKYDISKEEISSVIYLCLAIVVVAVGILFATYIYAKRKNK